MGSYFKPWRRKIGVLTLFLACVSTFGWVRSLTIRDELWRYNGQQHYGLISEWHSLKWIGLKFGSVPNVTPSVDWESAVISTRKTPSDFFGNKSSCWRWRYCGFGYGESESGAENNSILKLLFFPYWSIVVPLTLLSAWLLLSKVRQKQNAPPQAPGENR
jgi:hypothetical protein